MNVEINFERLLEYLNQHRPVTFGIAYQDNDEPVFKFNWGKYADNSSRVEYFSLNDLKDILFLNNIPDLQAKTYQAFNALPNPKDYKKHDKQMDDLKYGTLAKYIVQMLSSSMGKNYFPELKYLKQHERWFVFEQPA